MPRRRSATARASAGSSGMPLLRPSNTTKSLPRPCIFKNAVMGRYIGCDLPRGKLRRSAGSGIDHIGGPADKVAPKPGQGLCMRRAVVIAVVIVAVAAGGWWFLRNSFGPTDPYL